MQRAALREERTKKEEEVKPDVSVGTSTAVTRKWYFSLLNSKIIYRDFSFYHTWV